MSHRERDANELESTVFGRTVRTRAHSLSVWFVLALRLMMGVAFLWSGAGKLLGPEPFDAQGYLLYATPQNGSPLADLFVAMGQTDWFVAFVNVAVPWGEVFIGLGLIVGAFVRFAAFFGALPMLLFYLGNWDMAHGPTTAISRTCSRSSLSRRSVRAACSASTPTSSSTESAASR